MTLANDDNYYNCADNNWSLVNDRVKINTQGWACLDSNDGEMKKGLKNDAYFACDAKAWREARTDEEKACLIDGLCSACTGNRQGEFETKYVCDTKQWRKANCAENATNSLCTANDSAVVWQCEDLGNFKIDYICSNNKWHAVEHPFEYTLADWEKKKAKYYTAEMYPNAEYGDDFTDPRDKNVYKTIIINGYRIFAENLRYGNSNESVNLKNNSQCFNNEEKNCSIGGRYYTWTAAVNLDAKRQNASAGELICKPHQGLCSKGWHIPTAEEWKALNFDANMPPQMMGFSGRTAEMDVSVFSALPTGYHDNNDDYSRVGYCDNFWSATEPEFEEDDRVLALTWGCFVLSSKKHGHSVRCFQNQQDCNQMIRRFNTNSRKSFYAKT